MKRRFLYDLDGTLSTLNNTYDFIYAYLAKKHPVRRRLVLVCHKLLDALSPISYASRRRVLLLLQFRGLRRADLQAFFASHYREVFLSNLTGLGEAVLEEGQQNATLLTGCTEVPATAIAGIFGFGEVICTTFVTRNDRITGIGRDTYGNLKTRYVDPIPARLVYYTDDPMSENELCELMDEVIIVP